jgi:hypothetical protein
MHAFLSPKKVHMSCCYACILGSKESSHLLLLCMHSWLQSKFTYAVAVYAFLAPKKGHIYCCCVCIPGTDESSHLLLLCMHSWLWRKFTFAVAVYAFLALSKKVYIQAQKFFFGRRVNFKLETPTPCARCLTDFQEKCLSPELLLSYSYTVNNLAFLFRRCAFFFVQKQWSAKFQQPRHRNNRISSIWCNIGFICNLLGHMFTNYANSPNLHSLYRQKEHLTLLPERLKNMWKALR